jgi:hypothetical protein
MSDTSFADANAARVEEMRTKRAANLAVSRAARAERLSDDLPAPEAKPAPEPTYMEKTAMSQEAERQRRLEALKKRRADAAAADAAAAKRVQVRITKWGDGQISTGEHADGLGDLTYEKGETPHFPEEVALALESRGYVEIQE